jgi:aminoglycoside/choline kinase family phosphotransferase
LNPSTDTRLTLIHHWLRGLPAALELDIETLRPASSDASFRRYFRLDAGAGSVIVMDAPPPQEDTRPFLRAGDLLRAAGLNVPAVLAQAPGLGLLLLSDLGVSTYYQRIQAGLDDARLQTLYREALAALARMQRAPARGLPAYDAARMSAELELFPEWYLSRHHGIALDGAQKAGLRQVFDLLAGACAVREPVFTHRDFHSPNLMVCDDPRYGPNPGVIDFQDALAGPLTYDLASLVMDARTTWEEAQQLDWAIRYWDMARAAGLPVDADFAEFHRAYEWMGLQRNLRILGVFARLNHRDGKPGYLAHIPRVVRYARQVAQRYGVFAPIVRLLDLTEGREPVAGYTF